MRTRGYASLKLRPGMRLFGNRMITRLDVKTHHPGSKSRKNKNVLKAERKRSRQWKVYLRNK